MMRKRFVINGEFNTAGKESFLSSLLRIDILIDCWAVDICP
ncbi:hypothetical protein ACFSGI_05405 [Paenibacillus nicotianae]|uniref:Uncharacterized protein n=1 Tax=Paenibacillus nicotianae TaxID=1526551 RepID=A0ABW4USI5_9BACL